jgi:hypothetical protein
MCNDPKIKGKGVDHSTVTVGYGTHPKHGDYARSCASNLRCQPAMLAPRCCCRRNPPETHPRNGSGSSRTAGRPTSRTRGTYTSHVTSTVRACAGPPTSAANCTLPVTPTTTTSEVTCSALSLSPSLPPSHTRVILESSISDSFCIQALASRRSRSLLRYTLAWHARSRRSVRAGSRVTRHRAGGVACSTLAAS